MKNETSLDTLCAALAYAAGIAPPAQAAEPTPALMEYIASTLGSGKADRVFMYNPDAIAQWLYQKYPQLLREVTALTDVQIPFCTVMPSVTPVCFGTMYTGAQPEVHGIRRYEKPVITIDTIFDSLIRSGKRAAIVAENDCSLSKIYLQREMDYYFYDTVPEVNAKAAELILADEYDFIVVYNGNYDTLMHKFGPESIEALSELRSNAQTYAMFDSLIRTHWTKHNTLMGFAMDHGCHEIDGDAGSHGLDMDEDLNILHFYKIHPSR